ncbi:MAG: glycosyltransferase, partial [Candidatus Competibacterales bacterium]
PNPPPKDTQSYGELLGAVGWWDTAALAGAVAAWRTLVALVNPALVVCDHAPTALLALRGQPPRRLVFGTGFCCPPPWREALPIQPWRPVYRDRLRLADAQLLAGVNEVLRAFAGPPLDHLGALYDGADGVLLTTYPPLDHFPQRPPQPYYGAWRGQFSAIEHHPPWPGGDGGRLLAYLKPHGPWRGLLPVITGGPWRALIHVEGLDGPRATALSTATATVVHRPLPMDCLGEADAALLNVGHGMTCESLWHGVPVVGLPLSVEQRLLGEALRGLGAGVVLGEATPEALGNALAEVLGEPTYGRAARDFACHTAIPWGDAALAGTLEALEAWL